MSRAPLPFRIVALATAHLLAAMTAGLLAYGLDLDQLRSRSLSSRAAAVASDVLWFPHDRLLRAIPNRWLVEAPAIIPGAIIANSLAWAVALHLAWRALQRHRAP